MCYTINLNVESHVGNAPHWNGLDPSFLAMMSGKLNQILSTFKFTNSSTSQPSITVISPNGGETYNLNADPFSVSWTGTNLASNDGIHFSLVSTNGTVTTANAMGTGLDLRATGGSAILNPGSIQSGSYRLKITDDYSNSDMSNNYFTITN
jgi:hypothetical protein